MHSEEVSYDEAMRRLTARGYALWDVVADSERKGSLDGDIKNPTFADVQALVELSFWPALTLAALHLPEP